MPEARLVSISTPLDDGALLFRSMSAREELGRLFECSLELLSEDPNIKLEELLGQPITMTLELGDGAQRYFNGLVTRFSLTGTHGKHLTYHATLRPWFWFLTRKSDCRIFQEKTVPDIIKEVFRDNGFSDFEESLSGSYRTWEYCVQYRETDFNFISRLMEQEGIYYYFKHEDGKHTLIMSDSVSSHEAFENYEEIPYKPTGSSAFDTEDHIETWQLTQAVQPGAYALRDFDFEKPRAKLDSKSSVTRDHQHAEFEVYDYPGEYLSTGDGDNYVSTRIEELQAQYERVEANANARGLAAGYLFTLTEFPRDDQNREYLIVSATHEMSVSTYESGAGGEDYYACSIAAMDSKQQFRSQRITPKPAIQGPQTAVVVGKSGEEIWTDKYARVKVQFHWDRVGASDENSSCWVRVANAWAGKKWGGIHIPRMGQEVIVEFLEGDPDRPIITGRVYNADNMPPYELPANATQSGIKSRSAKEGSPDNFNEIRFEDKKGEEEVYIHAEKDQNNTVENNESTSVGTDRSEDVGNDETINIGNNRTETVGTNENITIGADRTETVGSNETISIGSSRSVTIGSNKTETIAINKAETIGVAKELTIGGAYQVTVGAAMNETVGAAKAEEIGGIKSVNVGANSSENIGGNKSVDAGKNISESAGKDVSISSGKKMTLTAGDDFALKGDKKGVIEIADQLTIKCGKATIVMKKNGDITINGKKITVKGSGDVIIKGSKVLAN